jgi:hypothetical protein
MREYQPFLAMLLPDRILGIKRNSGATFPNTNQRHFINSDFLSLAWLQAAPPLFHCHVSACFFVFYILST